MAIKYLYENEVFSPEDVEVAAGRRNMNPQEYTKKFNIQEFEDTYQKDGIDVPFEQIVDESTKSGVNVSDYIASNNFKKKVLSVPQQQPIQDQSLPRTDQSLLTGAPVAGQESKATSPSPSQLPSEPVDPRKLSRERIKLLADLQKVKDNPIAGSGVTDEFTTQATYEPRTGEIESIQSKIDDIDGKLAGAGYKIEEYDTLANLPDWVTAEGGWASPKNIARYSLENPAWGNRQKAKIGAMDAFVASNDYNGAREVQNLLVPSSGQPNTVADLTGRVQMINTLTDSRIPQDKEKVKQYVSQYLKPEFNRWLPDLNKQNIEAYKIDSDQEAALQEMKLLEPQKYEDTIKMLAVPYQSHTGLLNKPLLQWDLDKQRGLEKVRYDLKVKGRNNAIDYASSRLYDWKIKFDKATSNEERADAAMQMEQWKNRIDSISQEAKADQKNYPLYYEDQNKRAVTDLLDDPDFNPFTYAWKTASKKIQNIAEGTGEMIMAPVNAIASVLVGPEYEGARMATKIGQAQAETTEMYLPESMQFVSPGAVISPNNELKSFVDKVKASGKSSDEQRKDIESYLEKNPNSYEHIENPNAGERKGIFSEASLFANIKTVADIAALAGAGTTATAYKILGPTMSTALPFYMDVQQEGYKQRLASGENSSTAYQNSVKDGLVVAAATLISPIHKIASAALGKASNSAIKNTIGGLSESEWNAITSKYNRYIVAGSNSLKAMAKEGAKMATVYGAGTTVGQELLEITPDKKDLKEIVQNGVYASYDMLTSSGILLGLTGINNFKTISPQAKQSIYTMANDHLGAKAYFDFLQKNGTISEESATQKKGVVDKLVNVLSQVPTRDKNGRILTEEQRAGYLYRAFQKQQAAEMSKTMPEETKTEIDTKVKEMDADNAKIINGTLESDLTPSAAEPAPEVPATQIAENFKKDFNEGKLERGKEYGGGRNLGVYDYEGGIVKVVKEKRKLGEDQLTLMKQRLGDMDNVYIPKAEVDLGKGRSAIVMDKATGIDASTLTKEQIDAIPQEHWDKFEADIRELSKRGVAVDLTKRDNFFYNKDKGFSFIDISGISINGEPTAKFFVKDGVEYYYKFEQYPFSPKKFEGGKKMFENIPEIKKAEPITVDQQKLSVNVAPEIARIKSLDITAEDGATFNLDGTKYEGKGLVVPVVGENLAKGEVTEQKMAEFVAKHGDKVGELTKPGVFKFPGEDKVSLDLNIVVDAKNKDVALEFARRAGHKSLFDLDTMTYIETGATGEKPMDFTADQFKEINLALSKGEMPNVFGEKAEGFTAETAKTIDTTGMNEVQKGVIADAPNVLSAITPVMVEAGKKPQLFTYKTDAEYGKAVEGAGGTKEDSTTKGFYMDADGSIHINLNRATPETMMHEGFHPVLNLLAENKPDVITELFRQLDTIPVAKAMIDKARANYTGNVTQMKEAITDFNARVANGEIKLDATTFEKIKQFFVDLMNKIGFSIEGQKIANMKNAAELKNVAELIKKAFTTGEAIKGTEIKDIQAAIEKANQKRVETGEMSAGEKEGGLMFSRTDYGTSGITKKPALDKEEYKAEVASGRISVVDPYKSLENKKFAMTFPDDFFTGTIEVNGEPIGYGNGGVFYTAKHGKRGDAWASVSEGSASNFVTQANKSLEANKGEGIVAIVKGDDMKHKTSLESKVTFVNTILKYAEKTGDTAGVVKAIKSAYNLGNVKDPAKIIEYFNNYLASGRAESGQRMIDAGVSFDTFMASMIKEARPAVTKMMQDMGYKGEEFFDGTQLKKGVEVATTKGLKNVYSDMLREDFLKNVKPGSAYAAIKFTSPLKFEKDPAHPSYPYVIRTVDGSPVKLEVFDRTFNTYGKDVAVTGKERDETKAFGVATTVSPEFSIKPEMKGNPSEVSLSQSLTSYEALKKPEFSKGDLVAEAGVRKQMTEDDKGNYLFYHYSGADLKSIDPKKFGKNLATGRDERPGIGISMYYTRPDVLEVGVPSEFGYAVRIPKSKVYPFNKDPLNLLPEAEKTFKKMYPGQAFDLNKQVAFVTQEASKKGYPMTVAEWNIKGRKVLRAQTTEAMKPERYSNIVPGTMNQVEYNPELSKFKPNAKRRDIEFSREEEKTAKDIISENIQIGKPEKKGAVARFFNTIGDENFNVNWIDRVKREMLDSMAIFDKAAERVKGIRGLDEVLPANDPMTLVRLLNGFDASFNSAMDRGMFNSKFERIKTDDGKVMNIDWLMQPMGEMSGGTKEGYQQAVKDVTAYMVAKRTVELSKRFGREEMISGIGEGNVTDLEVAKKALSDFENDPNKANIEEAAKRYQQMADAGLRYMVDKGRLAEEVRDKNGDLIGGYKFIKENNLEYVALQRLNETETGEPIEFKMRKGGQVGSVSEPIKRIKGSEKRIQDPYVSLLDNINRMMKEADRNEVVLTFRNLIENEKDPQIKADLESIGKKVGSKDKETVTVFVDGKPEYWKFQPDIYTALKGLDSEGYKLPGFVTVLPQVLRWTVTRFPTFAARNIVRDFQSRLILSNSSPWESVKRSVTTADKWDEAARVGALNAGMYTQGKELYYELLRDASNKIVKDGSYVITPDKLKSLWHTYEKALYKSETTGRVSEYESSFNEAKKKGMDDYNAMLYAGSRARGLIDFAVAGNTMKVINQLIPFSNAAVQGLRSAAMRVKENPAGFAMRVALFSLIPEVAMYSLNSGDEKKKKMYEALPDWQRDMFYNVYVGNNKWLSIPKPFELSLFGSALNRGMSYAEGNKKAFDGFGGSTYKSLMPVEGTDIVGPYGKILEVAANYDFFRDKEIIPRSQLALDMSLRDTEDASRIGKVMGEFMNKDPRMVDHFIKGQFSYFGKTALELSNMGRPKGEARDEFKLSEKSGFVKENSAYVSKPVQELRDFTDKWGLNGHRWMKYFRMYQNNYFNEKDPKVKEQLGIEMMDFAEQLLSLYKEVGIEELQKIKKGKE